MKHRLFSLVAALALIVSAMTGCVSSVGSSAGDSSSSNVGDAFDKHDGLPPLSDSLKEVYTKAAERYQTIMYMQYDTDEDGTAVTINGTDGYVKVSDSRFTTIAALKAYLGESFTDDYIKITWFPEGSKTFAEKDGVLYVMPYGKGADILYRGHIFALAKEMPKQINFKAMVYDAKNTDAAGASAFYSAPSNSSEYDIRELPFSMVKCDDGAWRFQEFSDIGVLS